MRASLFLTLLFLAVPGFAQIPPAIEDPKETVGPRKCAECHDAEHEVWLGTAHAKLYDSDSALIDRPKAEAIQRKLGIKLIKHDSLCLKCHFTPTLRGSRVTAVAGVSCESCHGAADDWVHQHNTWQGRRVNRATEDPATTRARRARMAELGMRSPGDMYALLGACYKCHMVPDERLVMEGEHPSGSSFKPIEGVDEIKHTFVTAGSRTEPAPLSSARKRQLYVLGQALELETRLRQIAEAESSDYAQLLAPSVPDALRNLERVQRAENLPEIQAMVQAAQGLPLEAGHRTELLHAAEKVAEAARTFSRTRNGSGLDALDQVIAGGSGSGEEGGSSIFADLVDDANEEAPGAQEVQTPGKEDDPDAPGTPSTARLEKPEGKIRLQIREPLSNRPIVGPKPCGGCHQHRTHIAKWRRNAHSSTMNKFWEPAPRQVQIARTYFGTDKIDQRLTHKDSVCMSCHGTVPSGSKSASAGVSCESCHGPAGDYLDSHDTISRSQRLSLGMVDLKNLERRAEVCASCHYINDRRLLSSGHPSGQGFDPVARLAEIEHWDDGPPPAGAWQAAYRKATAARGPVPQVRVVSHALPASPSSGARNGGTPGVSTPGPRPVFSGGPVPAVPPVDPGRINSPRRPVDLPPWPEAEGLENRPTEDILREVQKRLETLYDAIRESGR